MRTVAGRLRERLERSAAEAVLGREREMDHILRHFDTDGAVVTFVHGIGGIGKSSVLAAVAPRLADRGARVVRLDGRTIEPTPHGLFAALGQALGAPGPLADVEAMARELDSDPRVTAIVIDEYDRIRLLDAWLRHEVLPAQPERTRWLFAGRFSPHAAWLTTPGWSDAVLSLRLDSLDEISCRALLARRGIADESMAPMIGLARGSPLALELAARYATAPDLGGLGENAVLDALARRCVEDLSPPLREAIDAMSIVRSATKSLLDAMVGRSCDDAVLGELADLSFVERAEEGLVLHDSVRHAVVSRLRALDPVRHRALRLAALAHLEGASEGAAQTGPNAWRLTADLLFIVEHPEIREAFFPSHETTISIDSALPGDRDAVFAIAERHEPPEVVRAFEHWWTHGRSFFDVARDVTGRVLGFAILAASSAVPRAIVEGDALVRAWMTDLETGPGRDRGALFHRRALSAEHGEEPCDARGALWLAAKRAYVARPGQWALYVGTRQQSSTLRLVQKFGFRASGIRDGDDATLLLEFGAAGIWSWLRALTREDVVPAAGGWRVVESSRGLLVDGRAIALSPLEYGVVVELVAAHGAVVTRDELLDRVWKQRHTGSNVVDALVRLLRKKLGPHAADIETVKGHGFRIAERNALET
ncbi:MAG TPA: winged helix-turn-helix domain-containing protein [Polyangiaceae bacterium]|nr:winged helix-turn-helix domain-containing protein [Polyangiaceae bacterium]